MSNLFEQMGALIQPEFAPATNAETTLTEIEQKIYDQSLICQFLKNPEKINEEMRNISNAVEAVFKVKGTCYEISLDALNKRLSQLDNAKFEANLIKKILGV